MAYDPQTPATLKAYYPAFAAIPDATIQIYLDRVTGSDVDQSWAERDYGPAILAASAHRMKRAGVLDAGSTDDGSDLDGVSDFKSASFQVRFSDDFVKAQVAGGWESTSYGLDYLELLNRNKGGPRVTAPGVVPYCDGFNGWAGPMGYPARLFP